MNTNRPPADDEPLFCPQDETSPSVLEPETTPAPASESQSRFYSRFVRRILDRFGGLIDDDDLPEWVSNLKDHPILETLDTPFGNLIEQELDQMAVSQIRLQHQNAKLQNEVVNLREENDSLRRKNNKLKGKACAKNTMVDDTISALMKVIDELAISRQEDVAEEQKEKAQATLPTTPQKRTAHDASLDANLTFNAPLGPAPPTPGPRRVSAHAQGSAPPGSGDSTPPAKNARNRFDLDFLLSQQGRLRNLGPEDRRWICGMAGCMVSAHLKNELSRHCLEAHGVRDSRGIPRFDVAAADFVTDDGLRITAAATSADDWYELFDAERANA